MGQKGTGPASEFGKRVIDEVERARAEVGMSKAALIRQSGMGANTFHTKMRGEKPFNLNEIEKLAGAMGLDAMLVLRRAATVSGPTDARPLSERDIRDEITERRERRKPRDPRQIAASDEGGKEQE